MFVFGTNERTVKTEKQLEYWFEKLEIQGWNKKIQELSKGMAQKIQFVVCVHKPKLLILTKPDLTP
jgi:ABC-2 type transport system ATP-binding protein